LYPEGHPKRIEQDSQRNNLEAPSSSKNKKKKNYRTLHSSSEPTVDTLENPNDISISDAETQSGDEHEPSDNVNDDVHVDAQPSNNNDVGGEGQHEVIYRQINEVNFFFHVFHQQKSQQKQAL